MAKKFIVKWTINLEDDDTPLDTAKRALALLRDLESSAKIFTLQDEDTKECFSVDLDEEDENAVLPLTEEQFKNS